MQESHNTHQTKREGHIPAFNKSFLLPRYWGIWLVIGLLILLTFLPARWRNVFLAKLGRFIGRKAKRPRHRANVNLIHCFPNMSEREREALLDEMFATILPTIILVIQLGFRSPRSFKRMVQWHGKAILDECIQAQKRIILLVPHGWAIDIPGVLLAHEGHPIAAMFHHQRNPLIDYLWNKVRLRFGGRIHARQDGIKPFISSIRDGYIGYYLPDQDHGEEQSEFVDFFATYKATLPAIGRLKKLCRADVVPLFPRYEYQNGILHIYIRPVMQHLETADLSSIARQMNEEVEAFVGCYPEQYTWVLELLETRKAGESNLYCD